MSGPGSGGDFGNPLRKFKLVFLGEQSGERGGGRGKASGGRYRAVTGRGGPVVHPPRPPPPPPGSAHGRAAAPGGLVLIPPRCRRPPVPGRLQVPVGFPGAVRALASVARRGRDSLPSTGDLFPFPFSPLPAPFVFPLASSPLPGREPEI